MTYQETLDWLLEQLPMYHRIGKAAYKADLSTSINLAEALGNPEHEFKSVHIAGTNGKGSTAHYVASILQECGLKVGLHCSPHYFDFRERIKINGKKVEQNFVTDFIRQYRETQLDIEPSFFELTVLMAFEYFKEQNVDIAIIETGMGGRLDTTNIISPEVSVITNIGLDHAQFLGDTLEKIAVEKGGIIKKNTPVVFGEMDPSALEILMTIAEDKDAEVHLSGNYSGKEMSVFQRENIATAIQTCGVLETLGWDLSEDDYENGISKVSGNTSFIGRWQKINDNPATILDSAHNVDGISSVVETLQDYTYDKLRIVIGMVDDKDVSGVLAGLPKDAIYYFCKAKIPRAKNELALKELAMDYSLKGSAYKSVSDAFNFAVQDASNKDLVLVLGSIFVVGEVLELKQ